MNVVIGFIIFLVGSAVGFFAARLMTSSSKEQEFAEKANQSEAALQQYKVDVAEHLDSSAKLLEQMNATCQDAMSQMAKSTTLLQQATPTENSSMPFFSKETQEQLAQTVTLRHEKKEKKENTAEITEPPLDYSGNPSGLFDDKKQTVTNAE